MRGLESGRGAQQDEALAVRDDGVGGAGGPRVAELDASAEGVGDARKEGLAGAGSDLPSELPTLEFAELCRAVRIVRLHAEPTQGFAALLDGALQLRTEAVGSQGLILNSIEPDGTRMADLDRKSVV